MIVESSQETPHLKDPILIEALPGIGFVANIVGLHLIKEVNAKRFHTLHSPSFQSIALTTDDGGLKSPINELYYAETKVENDLIILYGNTQALSVEGQYELSSKILSISENLGCKRVITIGGLKKDSATNAPKIFCTATDKETLDEVISLGASTIQGRVYGAAGLLLGLAKLRGMHGYCILVETLGLYPDALASKVAFNFLSRCLGLTLDISGLDTAVEATQRFLGSTSSESTIAREKEF